MTTLKAKFLLSLSFSGMKSLLKKKDDGTIPNKWISQTLKGEEEENSIIAIQNATINLFDLTYKVHRHRWPTVKEVGSVAWMMDIVESALIVMDIPYEKGH